jgi:hypothetical protein
LSEYKEKYKKNGFLNQTPIISNSINTDTLNETKQMNNIETTQKSIPAKTNKHNNSKAKDGIEIKEVIFNGGANAGEKNSDYMLNFAKPSKEDYRVKRNEVFKPNANLLGDSAAAGLSEYKEIFVRHTN